MHSACWTACDTSEQAKRELDEIRESLKIKQSGWQLFQSNSNFRRAVFLGVLLQVMQQFTGMNVIMYYAPKIFEIAGFANTTQQMGHRDRGLVNVLATLLLSVWWIAGAVNPRWCWASGDGGMGILVPCCTLASTLPVSSTLPSPCC